MNQVISQTDEEKEDMYMKCTKKELIRMLIHANKHIAAFGTTVYYGSKSNIFTLTCDGRHDFVPVDPHWSKCTVCGSIRPTRT
jgi:hypothetical protein